ncbi:MAG: aspartate/glutamate racemase family protein [Anaerolineaceae bacterium]|nr:aspartate/glutamate racemase family protein [Anaerolineaceae bacterium]
MTENKKIGLMLPSSNTVMEPDFYHNLPQNCTLHTARMYLEDVTAQSESEMLDVYAMPAARDLASADVDVVVFGCTSAGALRGNKYEETLMTEISKITGVPTVSVSKSVRDTLKRSQAGKLVVITPYLDELNKKIEASLRDDGFDVLRISGLGIRDNKKIAQVSRQEILDFANKTVKGLQPDALFLSCTNFPAFNVLQELRKIYSWDAVSSNQAALDESLVVITK